MICGEKALPLPESVVESGPGHAMQIPDSSPRSRFDELLTRWPLMWLSLAFLAGILLASRVSLPWPTWLILAGAALVLAILVRVLFALLHVQPLRLSPATWLLAGLALLAGFLGGFRYQSIQPEINHRYIAWYNDRPDELLVTGVVAAPPDYRDAYTNLRLEVAGVNTGFGDISAGGLMLARLPAGPEYAYGETLRLRGQLQTPPEGESFSYRDYLARQGVRAYMPDAAATRLPLPDAGNPILGVIYSFKAGAVERIHRLFPDPEGSLLAGILLGEDNGLPTELQQAFKNTGTAHIIAISGFNIAIIAGLFVALFSRLLGPRRGTVAAVLGIVLYTVLVGATASVLRAAIMGGLGLFARQVGRRQTALNTLAFTAAVMNVINPYTLWDVGFQLSFFATLGLVLYAQPFQDWAVRVIGRFTLPETAKKIAAPISEFVLFTLAAQLTTLPIMAYHFGRISLVSVLANPFILPVQPAVMLLGGLALMLSYFYFPLGQVAAWVAWPFSAYTIRAVELFDRLPHGSLILGDFSLLFVLLFYAVLFGWTFSQERLKEALRPALTPAVVLSTLGVLAFLVFRAAFALPDGRLHVTFFDVGTGEAILIRTPAGRNILVNGGPSASLLADGLGRRLSPFDRQLDYLVIASTSEENLLALPATIDRFPPNQALWAGTNATSYPARQLDRWMTERSTPIRYAAAGDALDLGDGARLEVLEVTTRGAILLVEWGNFRLLLPSGLNFDSLAGLDYGAEVGPVSALLLAESGFGPINPPEWIEALRPQVAILSVAADDPWGLPDAAVLDSLAQVTLLRTDRDGWIDLASDGRSLWVESEK